MFKKLLFLILCIVGNYYSLSAQVTLYLNEVYVPIAKKDTATYYKTCKDSACAEGNVLIYYKKNDQLASSSFYTNKKLNGETKTYYSTGVLKSKASYKDDVLENTYDFYYPNGKIAYSKKEDKEKKWTTAVYHQAWDSTGKATLTNGTGLIVLYYENGKINQEINYKDYKEDGLTTNYRENGTVYQKETYKKGKLVAGESWDLEGKRYEYDENTKEKMPAFKGGLPALAQFMKDNLKYPRKASRKNIEGTVYVKFKIDTQGKVTGVEVVKGIFPECDEEAVRVIKSMPDWEAGVQAGRKVTVWFTYPIKFKLQR